jgi:hypothetical protein
LPSSADPEKEDHVESEHGRRYGIVHASWAMHPELGADEIAVLAILSTYADRRGWCGVGQQTLANRLLRSRSWVNRVIQRLAALKIVSIEHLRGERGRIAGCRYQLAGHGDICQSRTPETKMAAEDMGANTGDASGDHVADRVAGAHTDSPLNHSDTLSAQTRESGSEEGGRIRQPVPADWTPTVADIAYAAEKRPDLRAGLLTITEKFIASSRARDQRHADISAAWRLWVLRERTTASHEHHATKHRPIHSAQPDGISLGDRNRDAASACLERILARRSQPHAA